MTTSKQVFLKLKQAADELNCERSVLVGMIRSGILRSAFYFDGPVIAEEYWDEGQHESQRRVAIDVWVRGHVFLYSNSSDFTSIEMYATEETICTNLGDDKHAFKFRPQSTFEGPGDDQLRVLQDDIFNIRDRFQVPDGTRKRDADRNESSQKQLENMEIALGLLAFAVKCYGEASGDQRFSRGDGLNVSAIVELITQQMENMGVERHGLRPTTLRNRLDDGVRLIAEHSEPHG